MKLSHPVLPTARLLCFGRILLVSIALAAPAVAERAPSSGPDAVSVVELDGNDPGRVFDGIGGLSAGASSRLLIDYPEPQRSQILDFLFKPNFGAALHVLKVEIGGTVYSTWGSEPSHANTREEYEHPRPEYYDRGYEWWLMKEARKRNPEIVLESLAWGLPGWIGTPSQDNNARYLTPDTAEYTARFLKAARDYHGLTINYQGIHNEAPYTVEWIKTLRKALDNSGLQDVKIVAADGVGAGGWNVVRDISADPELSRAVAAVGVHYSGYVSSDDAKKLGKPIWDSEDAILGVSPWARAVGFAKLYNRNYIVGRMTKTVICSLITCNYENLAAWNIPTTADGGLTRANTPWSGHYEVSPSIWATAHTTQFTKLGWRYLDGACGLLGESGSYVALRSPEKNGDYSVIVETMKGGYALVVDPKDGDAQDIPPRRVKFNVKNLSAGTVHVWRSNKTEQFVQLPDITPENGSLEITLEGNSIYTLTTTTGQQKGSYLVPTDTPFPFSYKDNFESSAIASTPKYFSDQEGTFAVAEREDGRGKCLRQIIPQRGVEWSGLFQYPWTIIGDATWRDYEVGADVHLNGKGFVGIYGRIDEALSRPMPGGYALFIDNTGAWQLKDTTIVISSGKTGIAPGSWHNLKLRFRGFEITALIDESIVCSIIDDFHPKGAVALASSYDSVEFDNFSVGRLADQPSRPARPLENFALGGKTVASSQLNPGQGAEKATDGSHSSGWCPAAGKTAGEWLEVDFGKEITFDRTVIDQRKIDQYASSITAYKIQYWQDGHWKDAVIGSGMSIRQENDFLPVTASKARLLITAGADKSCVYEFQVYRRNLTNRDAGAGGAGR